MGSCNNLANLAKSLHPIEKCICKSSFGKYCTLFNSICYRSSLSWPMEGCVVLQDSHWCWALTGNRSVSVYHYLAHKAAQICFYRSASVQHCLAYKAEQICFYRSASVQHCLAHKAAQICFYKLRQQHICLLSLYSSCSYHIKLNIKSSAKPKEIHKHTDSQLTELSFKKTLILLS